MYSITCIQRPPEGSNKSSLLQQVVFNCRFYLFDLRRSVVSQQCSLKAVDRFIQVVSDKGLTVFAIWARLLHLKWLKCFFSAVRIRFSKKKIGKQILPNRRLFHQPTPNDIFLASWALAYFSETFVSLGAFFKRAVRIPTRNRCENVSLYFSSKEFVCWR